MSIASLQSQPSAADYDLPPSLAWKHELRARLREHQQRRGGSGTGLPAHAVGGHGASRSSRVAERVALRYRDAPSYGELLAASADAAAAAAIAAQHAVDAAHLAHAALSRWQADWLEDAHVEIIEQTVVPESLPQGDSESAARGSLGHFEQIVGEPNLLLAPGTSPSGPAQGVRTHAPLPVRSMPPARNSVADPARGNAGDPVSFMDALDVFAEAVVPAAQGLPAKLIEFPRELIALRKQRPRLAEGPFMETRQHQQDRPAYGGDIRIFEVDGAEADTHPQNGPYAAGIMETVEPERAQAAMDERRMQAGSGQPKTGQRGLRADRALEASTQSGWAAIHLGEHPSGHLDAQLGGHLRQPFPEQQPIAARSPAARLPEHGYAAESLPALHDLAPVSRRFMAALVDAAIVCFCFLLAVLIFASCAVHLSIGKEAAAIAVLVFCALATFYGWLFMSYGGGSTPGMRYAHIALCTFSDENPRRKDLQNRILATALSLLPLGLGAFWALLDEDKLSWHDRMTRTYQRSYR